MNKLNLINQINDLKCILICDFTETLIELSQHSPGMVEQSIKLTRTVFPYINRAMTNLNNIRIVKDRNLVDEFVKKFDTFDIHEALNISMNRAEVKLKNFDFTEDEKNIIMDKFRGDADEFLKKYGEVID